VDGGRAVRRTIEPGVTSEGRVEVLGGVSAGDVVVVTGTNAVRDGGPVRVVAGPGADASPAAGEQPGTQPTSAAGARSGR